MHRMAAINTSARMNSVPQILESAEKDGVGNGKDSVNTARSDNVIGGIGTW